MLLTNIRCVISPIETVCSIFGQISVPLFGHFWFGLADVVTCQYLRSSDKLFRYGDFFSEKLYKTIWKPKKILGYGTLADLSKKFDTHS